MLQYHLSGYLSKVGKNKGKTVYAARAVTRGVLPFDDFCREVADGSTVDVADVKAVLSRLHTVITRAVERGFSVEVGELGNFRPSFGSIEVLDAATFSPQEHIRRPKILFHPRASFVGGIRAGVGFERVELAPKAKKSKPAPAKPESGEGHGGSEGHEGHVGI